MSAWGSRSTGILARIKSRSITEKHHTVRLIVSAMLISHDTVFFFHNKTTSATYKSQKRSSEQSVTQRGEGEKVGGHIIPSTDKDPLRNDKEEDGAQMDAFHMVWVE